MDIFEAYLSSPDESIPTFSAFFQSAQDLKESLGTKGYLLDHYLSLCFRLIAQIDFVSLQDEISDAMAAMMRSISDVEAEKAFACQEVHTGQMLWLISHADALLQQAFQNFIQEKTFSSGISVDIIDLKQTEEKIKVLIGQEKPESCQRMFLHRFLFSSVAQLFLQGMTTELIRRFLTTDIETGGEVFRIYLKNFGHEKNG
ncbi:hypothetical protein [Anaerotignum sp.]|uniref:hypothetical protein n=1 Tax=Anaerotignum sp. TaxID=2039241 RepID=UPI002A9128CE|nr:hypothetical protein [Anaerotignum sp.]MDY5415100.1 hypothetical protein [Anaerotignum sp.]